MYFFLLLCILFFSCVHSLLRWKWRQNKNMFLLCTNDPFVYFVFILQIWSILVKLFKCSEVEIFLKKNKTKWNFLYVSYAVFANFWRVNNFQNKFKEVFQHLTKIKKKVDTQTPETWQRIKSKLLSEYGHSIGEVCIFVNHKIDAILFELLRYGSVYELCVLICQNWHIHVILSIVRIRLRMMESVIRLWFIYRWHIMT